MRQLAKELAAHVMATQAPSEILNLITTLHRRSSMNQSTSSSSSSASSSSNSAHSASAAPQLTIDLTASDSAIDSDGSSSASAPTSTCTLLTTDATKRHDFVTNAKQESRSISRNQDARARANRLPPRPAAYARLKSKPKRQPVHRFTESKRVTRHRKLTEHELRSNGNALMGLPSSDYDQDEVDLDEDVTTKVSGGPEVDVSTIEEVKQALTKQAYEYAEQSISGPPAQSNEHEVKLEPHFVDYLGMTDQVIFCQATAIYAMDVGTNLINTARTILDLKSQLTSLIALF
jgi:hypothetical protein